MKHKLNLNPKEIYLQNGIITFLLFFAPLIPGFIESHTKTYLIILDSLTKDVSSAHDAIKLVFGRRGLKVYKDHLEQNPQLVRPTQIFRLLYQENDTDGALKLIDKILFDKTQRKYPYSDIMRATIITEIPRIIESYQTPKHSKFRNRLIHQLVLLAQTETALQPRHSLITTYKSLLITTANLSRRIRQHRIDTQLNMLSAKLKAELAGIASPYTASYGHLVDMPQVNQILTQEEVDILIEALKHLTSSLSPEISDSAKFTLAHIESYDLNVIN